MVFKPFYMHQISRWLFVLFVTLTIYSSVMMCFVCIWMCRLKCIRWLNDELNSSFPQMSMRFRTWHHTVTDVSSIHFRLPELSLPFAVQIRYKFEISELPANLKCKRIHWFAFKRVYRYKYHSIHSETDWMCCVHIAHSTFNWRF